MGGITQKIDTAFRPGRCYQRVKTVDGGAPDIEIDTALPTGAAGLECSHVLRPPRVTHPDLA